MHQLFAVLRPNRETVRNYLLSLCYKIKKTQDKNKGTIYDISYKIMYFRALDKKSGEVEIHRGSALNQSSLATNESLLLNLCF